MALPNIHAATLDPRTATRTGCGTVGDPDFVYFRRVFRSGDNYAAPSWLVNRRIIKKGIPGENGGIYRLSTGYDPDTLTLRVEVEDVATGNRLRALVGTELDLVLPDDPYNDDGATFQHIVGTGYRIQTCFLASAEPEGITARTRCERFALTFERARTAPS